MSDSTQSVAENTQRDAEVATPKANFELLSDETFTSDNINNQASEQQNQTTETKTDVNQETQVEQKSETDNSQPEEKELELENDSDDKDKADVTSQEEDKDLELTLDDDSSLQNYDDEASWKAIAKLEGIELEDDSYEAFKEALTKPLIEQVEEVKKMTKESLLSDLKPEHRLYMELAEMGLSHEEIVNPTAEIERYKAMDSAALYREDLMVRFPNAPQEWIDSEIEKKVESGDVEHEATRIRLELDNQAKAIQAERTAMVEQYKLNSEKVLTERKMADIESMKKTLSDVSEFMGSKLSPEVRKGLADRYASGKYDQIFSDPAMKAKFIAFVEFGDKALKNLEAKSYQRGKAEIAQKLHNVPPIENGGGGVQTRTVEGNFERLMSDPNLQG